MSRRGDNIRKRKDGRWEGRYISSRNVLGKAVYKSVYGKTYSEVKTRLMEESQKVKTKLDINNDITVNTIAEKWLQEIKLRKKYSTYVKYSYIYDKHIKQHLGSRKFKSIEKEDCIELLEMECFSENNVEEQLSKSTINSVRNVLTQIMVYGNSPISISYNVCKIQTSGNSNLSKLTVFTKEEQYKLQEYLLKDIDGYKLGIYVCMLTGLRLGEICALKTENIDLEKRVIFITQTVQRIKSDKSEGKTELLVTRPKTEKSIRVIPICDILLRLFKDYMSNNIYLVNGNQIMEPRTYQYFFHRVLKSLSIEEKNFHSLRHTFATNCIASGMDVKCLSEILGHADVKTTLNKYVHPSLEQKREQLNSFASNYGQKNGQF